MEGCSLASQPSRSSPGASQNALPPKAVNVSILTIFDAGSPAAALGYGIGRIGCFLSGDGDYGIPTSLPWGMSFPNGLVPTTQRVHPTPIYELIVACAIAWWLWRMRITNRSTRAQRETRQVFAAYLILTGVARFLVEFIRINPALISWNVQRANGRRRFRWSLGQSWPSGAQKHYSAGA